MAIRHVNPYGRVEYLDSPLSDCSCKGCEGAKRRERRVRQPRRSRRGRGWQGGSSVDGQSARTKESGDRTDVIWGGSRGNRPGDGHGHVVSKDGINAEYVRDPGMDHDDYVVDERRDDPYGPRGSGE